MARGRGVDGDFLEARLKRALRDDLGRPPLPTRGIGFDLSDLARGNTADRDETRLLRLRNSALQVDDEKTQNVLAPSWCVYTRPRQQVGKAAGGGLNTSLV